MWLWRLRRKKLMHDHVFRITGEDIVQPWLCAFISGYHLLKPHMSCLMKHESHQAFQRFRFPQNQGRHSIFHSAITALYERVSGISVASERSVHKLEKLLNIRFAQLPKSSFFRLVIYIINLRAVQYSEAFYGVIFSCCPSKIEDVFGGPFPGCFVLFIG